MVDAPVLLAARSLGLGDFVTGVPALRALESAFPGHTRFLAAPAWYGELIEHAGLNWSVVPTDPLRTPSWRGPAPELAVNLHGRGPQSTDALLALAPEELWAHECGGLASAARAPWPGPVHDARLWCDLLEWYGVSTDPEDLRWPWPGPTDVSEHTVIVHPGAASVSRQWPPLLFARVVRYLGGLGFRVLLTGSAEERATAEQVAGAAGSAKTSVLAGRTDIDRLVRLVANARLLVCGDTGVAHVATAHGTPSVRLFGPVPPSLWGPLVDTDLHECLWSGRRGDPHADRLDPGLAALTVDEVCRACDRVLRSTEHLRSRHRQRHTMGR